MPLDDEKTFELFKNGNTIGIFQLESSGMRNLIKKLKPSGIDDIIALLALYRPGPLGSGMDKTFVSNKHGKAKIEYAFKELEPILKATYGVIIYQEQIMQIANVIAGFSIAEADILRKAMGKKKKDVMDAMKDKFVSGGVNSGFDEERCESLYKTIESFAEYGFSRSHAAAYGLISYQTAYLKANYPLEYMTALLSSTIDKMDKNTLYINECKEMGINILNPNINKSLFDFTIDGDDIRIGLGLIKNIGDIPVDAIINNERGYKSFADFCFKVDLSKMNKSAYECLIKCGVFDETDDRSILLVTYKEIVKRVKSILRAAEKGEVSLLNGSPDELIDINVKDLLPTDFKKLSFIEKAKMEKELTGIFLTGSPLEKIKDYETNQNIGEMKQKKIPDSGVYVRILGMFNDCKKKVTKVNTEMIVGTFEDRTGEVSVFLFLNGTGNKTADKMINGNIAFVEGYYKNVNGKRMITVSRIENFFKD